MVAGSSSGKIQGWRSPNMGLFIKTFPSALVCILQKVGWMGQRLHPWGLYWGIVSTFVVFSLTALMASFLVSSGHRFYYSNALADWMAITNEKAANPCSYFEIQQGECMEYYGMRRGRYICKDYYDDFLECRFQFKQVRRLFLLYRTQFSIHYDTFLFTEIENHCYAGKERGTIQRIFGRQTWMGYGLH